MPLQSTAVASCQGLLAQLRQLQSQFPDCDNGLGTVRHVERLEYRSHVYFDCAFREVEIAADKLIGLTLYQQRQHIGLARRQSDFAWRKCRTALTRLCSAA